MPTRSACSTFRDLYYDSRILSTRPEITSRNANRDGGSIGLILASVCHSRDTMSPEHASFGTVPGACTTTWCSGVR
jgi:hypothetical protein